jgi:hypothetical protein
VRVFTKTLELPGRPVLEKMVELKTTNDIGVFI